MNRSCSGALLLCKGRLGIEYVASSLHTAAVKGGWGSASMVCAIATFHQLFFLSLFLSFSFYSIEGAALLCCTRDTGIWEEGE